MPNLAEKYRAPLRLSSLSEQERDIYDACQKASADSSLAENDILTILIQANFSMASAMKLAECLGKAHAHHPLDSSVLDLAPFCSLDGGGGPDACEYLLENEKGQCARDIYGRPIAICRGMFFGSTRENIAMVNYMRLRASQHIAKDTAKSLLIVFDLNIYQGATQTFRYPDSAYQELLRYQQQYMLELMGSISNVAVVGLPKTFATILDMMRRAVGYGCSWSFHTTYQALLESGIVTRQNLPPEHGGTFDFNLTDYVKWRAREEGVEDQLQRITHRRFNDEDLSPLYSGVKGSSYLIRFPPTQAMVDSMRNSEYSDEVFIDTFQVNGKPTIVVLAPWNELRMHRGTNLKRLGKVKYSLKIDENMKMDTFTDFVFESADGSVDKRNVSARYSLVIQQKGDDEYVIEALDSSKEALQKMVQKLTRLLGLYDTAVNHSEGITELSGADLTPYSIAIDGAEEKKRNGRGGISSSGLGESSSDFSETGLTRSSPGKGGVSWNNVLNFLGSD